MYIELSTCKLILSFTLGLAIFGIIRRFFLLLLAIGQRWIMPVIRFYELYHPPPLITVVIPAFNEEKVIVQTLQAVLASNYQNYEVIVVDDGSQDMTFTVASQYSKGDERIRVLSKINEGKFAALNYGIVQAKGDIIVALDADTLFAPETISRLIRPFVLKNVGAVAGCLQVGNATNIITRCQSVEYIINQNYERYALSILNCIGVVPGAVGAWRKSVLLAAGGFSSDTMAEDADMTWMVRKMGWRVCYERSALAFTESPNTFRSFIQQRHRWTFGTFQTIWKHREALFRLDAYGLLVFPGIVCQMLSYVIQPCVIIIALFMLITFGVEPILIAYLSMVVLDVLLTWCGSLVLKEHRCKLSWVFFQWFLYKPLMTIVIIKSLWSMAFNPVVKWHKLERNGNSCIDNIIVANLEH